jgi:hypothetical protein
VAEYSVFASEIAMPPQAQLASAPEQWKECGVGNLNLLQNQAIDKVLSQLRCEKLSSTVSTGSPPVQQTSAAMNPVVSCTWYKRSSAAGIYTLSSGTKKSLNFNICM